MLQTRTTALISTIQCQAETKSQRSSLPLGYTARPTGGCLEPYGTGPAVATQCLTLHHTVLGFSVSRVVLSLHCKSVSKGWPWSLAVSPLAALTQCAELIRCDGGYMAQKAYLPCFSSGPLQKLLVDVCIPVVAHASGLAILVHHMVNAGTGYIFS